MHCGRCYFMYVDIFWTKEPKTRLVEQNSSTDKEKSEALCEMRKPVFQVHIYIYF
jgi:hypothetical protein